jgi:PAS domain S-box-containing protein
MRKIRYLLTHSLAFWLLLLLLLSSSNLALWIYFGECRSRGDLFRKTLALNASQLKLLIGQTRESPEKGFADSPSLKQELIACEESFRQLKRDWNGVKWFMGGSAAADMESWQKQWESHQGSLTKGQDHQNASTALTIRSALTRLSESNYALGNTIEERQAELTNWAFLLMSIIGGAMVASLVKLYRIYTIHFLRPIEEIGLAAGLVAQGDLSRRVVYQASNQLGSVSAALNGIIEHQGMLAGFIEKMGDGNFDTRHQQLGEQDRLGHSLLLMHHKLLKVSEEEKCQRWANEGYARFAEILRINGSNLQTLGEAFLIHLVKYLGVNQGALFVLNEEDPAHVFLERTATYAWERQKLIKQQWRLGEGLVGEAAREGDTLHITDIPDDYVSISSGLGKANPVALLVVPFKTNAATQGVLELASFRNFEPFEIAFVEKLSESLAATLSTVKTNEQTQRLLDQSRQLNEHLKTQEQELRQHAEEMKAVQEDMLRKENELARQGEAMRQNAIELQEAKENLSVKLEEALAGMKTQIQQVEAQKQKNIAILEGCVDGVITFDQAGTIDFFNRTAEEMWNLKRTEVLGKAIQTLIPLRLVIDAQGFTAFYEKNNQKKPVTVRTEIAVSRPDGEEMDMLLTLTHAQIGEQHSFAAFVQRVSVELF